MELFNWIGDLIWFFRDIIILAVIVIIFNLLTRKLRFGNRMYYDDNNDHSYANQNNGHNYSYSHYHDDDENSGNNYDGLTGTGDFIMNGSMDDDLDFSNPNHYPIIDSYDNNKN